MSKYRVVQNKISFLYRLEKYDEFRWMWVPIGDTSYDWRKLEETMLKLVDAEDTAHGWEKPLIMKEVESA